MGSRGELAAGTVVDRKYRVERRLGAGGMGTVYEVTHQVTQRQLALKVLRPEYSEDADAVRRFLREVRVASGLRHPNVVEVYDAGRDPESELLYIAMERLEGEELAARMSKGSVPRLSVLGWIADVLPALAAAHELGVVHRDLKPENLFLARAPGGGEVVKLLDFGIARQASSSKLTQTGTIVGTPLYMSPEQALRPVLVDHRTDLWAIGVMLYEAIAGQPPFRDETPSALMLRAAAEPHQPLSELVPGIDSRLVALIDHCLQKNPAHRPSSAADVHAALRACLDEPRGDLRRGPARPSHATSALVVTGAEEDLGLARAALSSLTPAPGPRSGEAPLADAAAPRAERMPPGRVVIYALSALFALLASVALVSVIVVLPSMREDEAATAGGAEPSAAEEPSLVAAPPPVIEEPPSAPEVMDAPETLAAADSEAVEEPPPAEAPAAPPVRRRRARRGAPEEPPPAAAAEPPPRAAAPPAAPPPAEAVAARPPPPAADPAPRPRPPTRRAPRPTTRRAAAPPVSF